MILRPDLHVLICPRPGGFLLLLLAQRRLRGVGGKSREKTAEVCRKAGGEGTAPLLTAPLVTSMRLAWTKKGCRPTT
jgi:hypothetical protein